MVRFGGKYLRDQGIGMNHDEAVRVATEVYRVFVKSSTVPHVRTYSDLVISDWPMYYRLVSRRPFYFKYPGYRRSWSVFHRGYYVHYDSPRNMVYVCSEESSLEWYELNQLEF